MRTIADLHSHSLFSDGSLTLAQVCEVIRDRNLAAFSVTDHDRLDFYEQPIDISLKKHLIPGVELSTRITQQSIHLLVYHAWPIPTDLKTLVSTFSEFRKQRYVRILQALSDFNISESLTIEKNQSVFTSRQLCEFIAAKTNLKSLRQVYNQFLSKIRMDYREFPELPETLEMLQSFPGAKSFVAHPGHKGIQWEQHWSDWKKLGLTGIELVHPAHKGQLRKYYKKIIRRENFVASGGSDFHYPGGGNVGPGKLGLDSNQWRNFNDQCKLLPNDLVAHKITPETDTITTKEKCTNEFQKLSN